MMFIIGVDIEIVTRMKKNTNKKISPTIKVDLADLDLSGKGALLLSRPMQLLPM